MSTTTRSLAPLTIRQAALCLVLAALATAAPVTFETADAGFGLEPAAAFAKSGRGKGGDRDDDDDDDRDDRDDDRDDDCDDDDDRDDDRSRDDDDDDEDGFGRAGGDDSALGDSSARSNATNVAKIELSATGITVIYRDGSRDILSDGIFRREDAAGRVVARRTATGADMVRLRALASGRVAPASTSDTVDPATRGQPKKIRLRGNDVIVEYTSGWTERVERGRYRLTDRYGHVAVDRASTEADRARLRALAGR